MKIATAVITVVATLFGATTSAADPQLATFEDQVLVAGTPFFADGPIRFAPVVDQQRTYFGSDDGSLYCLETSSGEVLWKFRGGPSSRKILGAGRLISAWPVTGGPVVHDGRVYFAAGNWPMMGVFIYALDARTGEPVWVNDSSTAMWKSERVSEQRANQPQFEPSFISVAPRGVLSIDGDRLVVPCGRAEPAYYDLATGRLLEFHYGGKTPHKAGDGAPLYPDFDAIAEKHQHCFPADAAAEAVMKATGVTDGYAVVVGIGDGTLIEGLVSRSKLRVVAIDRDAKKVRSLRKRLGARRAYGVRASAHVGSLSDFGLPPYFASLIVAVEKDSIPANQQSAWVETLFHSLRPYGGVACLSAELHDLRGWTSTAQLQRAEISNNGDFSLLSRTGALPGSDDWSHEFAGPGNTRSTRDELVKAPFSVLWYGGPAGEVHRYYENHRGYGVPKVAGGRLVIEGPKMVSAFDIYTGRRLWEWRPGPVDKEPWHYTAREVHWVFEPLAGRIVATDDVVYVVSDKTLHALDAATGLPLKGFQFDERDEWGGVRVQGDALFLATGNRVLSLDRHRGTVRWSHGQSGGTLAIGKDRVFCIEYPWPDRFENVHISPNGRWTKFIENHERIVRRGGVPEFNEQKLVALDINTGNPQWTTVVPAGRDFVRRLIYSSQHDALLLTGNGQVLDGRDGKRIWRLNLMPTTAVSGDLVWGYGKIGVVGNLRTRTINQHTNPITLEPQSWKMSKTGNGCGPLIAAPNLLTFRSGSAAYFSLCGDMSQSSGVVNLGAFRSSCQPSLIPAGGLLVAPNSASGGCTCRYPNATALALLHDPDMEEWGSYGKVEMNGPVRRLGINLGAPGDRMAPNGTLWLDYPSLGGPSPEVTIRTEPARPNWIRSHVSRVIDGDSYPWVAASGADDLKSITVSLGDQQQRTFQVRVHYAELIDDSRRRRTFVDTTRDVVAANEITVSVKPGRIVCGIEIIDIKHNAVSPALENPSTSN